MAPTHRVDRRAPAPQSGTRRRAETRRRLLDAAFVTFAEQGFGRSTVEQVCERAGYTRGAFYSNFVSLDELFLAMWEQRSRELLARLRASLDAADVADLSDPRAAIAEIVRAMPLDEDWYRITADFTAHALRNPGLRSVVVTREQEISDTMTRHVEALLHRLGRNVSDPTALGQAIVAVHDGTAVQCLMEPDGSDVRERRVQLFVEVVMAFSVEGAS